MKSVFLALAALLATVSMSAQSLEDLNIQIHGYATQGFLYTTQNNVFATTSSDGSPQWTEAVVNVGAQPIPKLRVSVQARYELLGNYSNAITLDYAMADYKVNDHFGVRFGKVKTPSGLFNEIQDIDPSYLWALLPQGIYNLTDRNAELSHYGGVVYGTFDLGRAAGKLEYRGYGGERVLGDNDGYFYSQTEGGAILPNGVSGIIYGATIRWRTPLPGLLAGMSYVKQNKSSAVLDVGGAVGAQVASTFKRPSYFASYEKGRLMLAGEQSRFPVNVSIQFGGHTVGVYPIDEQSWYAMASYKLTDKLTMGAYDSQIVNRAAPLGAARYSKDWTFSGRYDFNQYLYVKAEEHLVNGTQSYYEALLNPALKPTTKLTILKIGVSF